MSTIEGSTLGAPAQQSSAGWKPLAVVAVAVLFLVVGVVAGMYAERRLGVSLPFLSRGAPTAAARGAFAGGPRTGVAAPLVDLNTAASAIGITPQQLRQELAGKSLADVARAHNVDPAKVEGALDAEANSRIGQAMTQPMPARPGGGRSSGG